MSRVLDSDLDQIAHQDDVDSFPHRENHDVFKNAINDNQTQIDGLTTTPGGTEVTNARDNHSVLRDRLRSDSKSIPNAVITGGTVAESSPQAMTVDVSSGEAIVNGVACKWTGQTSGVISDPATTLTRYDVVVINSDNTISVVTGTADADPVLPAVSISQKALAILTLTSGMSQITDSEIRECRDQGNYYYHEGRLQYKFKIQDAIDDITSGDIYIGKGDYYEEVDLSAKSNVTLRFANGAKVYRISDTNYAIKSINTVSNETVGLKILGGDLQGNNKAGSLELLKAEYTDEFAINGCRFDGNNSSTATYKNFVLNQVDNFKLNNNLVLDNSGDIDYTTSNITNATNYMEDGYYKDQVSFCGVTAQKAQMLKMGWAELTAMDDYFLRIDKDAAADTGGSDTKDIQHGHQHNHRWYDFVAGANDDDQSYQSNGATRSIPFEGVTGTGDTIYAGLKNGSTHLSADLYTDNDSTTGGAAAQDVKPAYYTLIALIHR